MKSARELGYRIHHLCVYDKEPRSHMWPYLRWHHGVTGFFSGATFHITNEGHSDYTFLGCGGRAFQIQLEAPPFQFHYEQQWYREHGNAYNHVCWIVDDARGAYEQLRADGASIREEFETFPTYVGFVMADPEGRWIEIMEYTDPVMRVQEFTHQPAGQCGLEMIGCVEVVRDLDAMSAWYCKALGLHQVDEKRAGAAGVAYLADDGYDSIERNTVMMLTTPRTAEEHAGVERHGPFISSVLYQARDVHKAWDDALWAGMEAIAAPEKDSLTGAMTARLREPSGNEITLRENFRPR